MITLRGVIKGGKLYTYPPNTVDISNPDEFSGVGRAFFLCVPLKKLLCSPNERVCIIKAFKSIHS